MEAENDKIALRVRPSCRGDSRSAGNAFLSSLELLDLVYQLTSKNGRSVGGQMLAIISVLGRLSGEQKSSPVPTQWRLLKSTAAGGARISYRGNALRIK